MKRKLIAMMLCVLVVSIFGGCGLFTSSDSDEGTGGDQTQQQEEQEDFSIPMTDTYTFTDPEDLEFDTRYVMTGDENCKLLSDMKNFGFTASAIYDIVYALDDKPVREYQYFICPDETSAADLAEYYTSQGQQVTQEGQILYATVGGDQVEAMITLYSSSGSMSGDTVEDYVDFMAGFNGLTEY
ncbi:MAG: hypothetical protein ACLRS1_00595 [Oscillospiraceae bacterium]